MGRMSERVGTVVRSHGGHYYVDTGDEVVDCTMRGRVKQRRAESDLIAVGDRVRWSPIEEGGGIIEEVLPRHTVLSRTPPPPRAPIEQVIVANPDQAVFIFAVKDPTPHLRLLDRLEKNR